jgi:hypothetical protein
MNGARAAAARILTWVTVVTDNYRLMTTVFCVIRPADERLHGLGRPSRPASLPELPYFLADCGVKFSATPLMQ